ncbi:MULTISPECIES: excinuclease ABC subunit UvrC [unclassified Thermosynechococcus]|uniref:excinuclease ABC subunit UvrC n=1 Tax=unclassified Thermosynechococcus TaxID=2622553 RepID=UPI0019F37BC5|nr:MULTISPECIES: excinuclease ABC subunit UvrC [unclassified Thermosynechococcus]HIK34605.1 excinuclease ABC subunit UvrC [Thermosynechococcus sp. M98_K2018_005]HIK47034.1 excinuclease ABC subunit UvrC [Thermosynechococcus sp. M55_K2018_012]
MLQPLIQDRDRLEQVLRQLPLAPGVYFLKDKTDQILYIGKSKRLRSRVRSYFREPAQLGPRLELMVYQVADIEFIVTDTEAEALALEANLIKQHQPHFNVLLKDDKKYPYVCITWSEPYPRIFITRKRQLGNIGDTRSDSPKDRYYGPYVDSFRLRQTLALVKRLFPLRQRPRPLFKDRPCLNYDMGRCPGVCQALISPQEYRQTLHRVAMIFQGRTGELVAQLQAQMAQAAADLNFELAARLRDQIRGLEHLGVDQKVSLPDDTVSRDAIALALGDRHAAIQLFQIRAGRLVGRLAFVADAQSGSVGTILQRVLEEHYAQVDDVEIPSEILLQHPLPEAALLRTYLSEKKGRAVTLTVPQRQAKAELIAMVQRNAELELARIQQASDRTQTALEDLAQLLGLDTLPHRIEGYDISHIQGSDAVASRVVFIDGLPAKQHYRHYNIHNPEVKLGHSDDFASLAEILRRRFAPYLEGKGDPLEADDWPDVILIDGGKGQLSAVVQVLEPLLGDLTLLSLAKQREEIFLPHHRQPLLTDPEQPGVQLLRRVRDEAHRFALNFHRQKRAQRQRRSHLDQIPGLGYQRQKELLATFRSIDYIRMATPEQLAQVHGVGPRLAEKIYRYFHADTD